MKRFQQSNGRGRRPVVTLVLIVLAASGSMSALARPRPPLPPLPERVGPVLWHEGFDWAWASRRAEVAVVVPEYGTLVESWSGYALQRSGWFVPPCLVPAQTAEGRARVACEADGAVRFWLRPGWSSPAAGGAGPGKPARLLELVVTDVMEAAVTWSLRVTPEGAGLVLLGQSETELAPLLKTEIAWSAGDWHQVGLNYGPGGMALFVDGWLVAEGAGTVAVPAQVAVLVVGSTLAGTETAEAEFEEVYAFGRPLRDTALSYRALAAQAALGPVSDAEWQARQEAVAKRRAEQQAASAAGNNALLESSGCVTNGPIYITNTVCALANQGWTVTFDLRGGTNGIPYDVFSTTNLVGNSGTNSQWFWMAQQYTCGTVVLSNQPAVQAFYVLGHATLDRDGDGMTDVYEWLVSHTDPTEPQPPFQVLITFPDANTLLP